MGRQDGGTDWYLVMWNEYLILQWTRKEALWKVEMYGDAEARAEVKREIAAVTNWSDGSNNFGWCGWAGCALSYIEKCQKKGAKSIMLCAFQILIFRVFGFLVNRNSYSSKAYFTSIMRWIIWMESWEKHLANFLYTFRTLSIQNYRSY